jgi:peptidoglycan/LPS O-acetylase OafA/YrhL
MATVGWAPVRTSTRSQTTLHDAAVDGFRGIAVLLLVIATYCGPLATSSGPERILGWFGEPAWTGSMLFLTLSGFLLTGNVWETLHSPDSPHPVHWLRNFYARRALRIFPLYYLLVLIATMLAVARGTPLHDTGVMKLYVWFVENLPFLSERAGQQPSPLQIQHLWMVAVLLQFAVAWPLLLLSAAGRRRARSLALGVVLSSILFCWVVWSLPSMHGMVRNHVFDQFSLTYASAFGLGAALYLTRGTELWEQMRTRLPLLLALGIAGFGLAGVVAGSFQPATPAMFQAGIPAAGLAATALLGLALEPGRLRSILSIFPFVWLGRLSYGIFLLHSLLLQPAGKVAERLTHSTGPEYAIVRLALGLLLSVILAFLSYELLERPVLSLRRHLPVERPQTLL